MGAEPLIPYFQIPELTLPPADLFASGYWLVLSFLKLVLDMVDRSIL